MDHKIKSIYVALLMCFATFSAYSQEYDCEKLPLHIELNLTGAPPYKGLMSFGPEIDLTYSIKRFSIHAILNTDYFIPKESETKNYNKAMNLGGGMGFELFPRKTNASNTFEARASVTSSVGSGNFKNTAFKIGINWHLSGSKRRLSPTIGLGYCLRNFHDAYLSTYHGGFLSFGIRF